MTQTVGSYDENAQDTMSQLARKGIELGVDPVNLIEGITKGLKRIGNEFEKGERFLPDLIMASEIAKAGTAVIEPELKRLGTKSRSLGAVVIGTVQGDIHSIGKDIVASMLEANNFEVHNLGVDISRDTFVEKVRELRPNILGLSALLNVTLIEQKAVIEALKKAGLRTHVKVMVGGAPATVPWAKKIGSDGYAPSAVEAVRLARKLIKQKNKQE